MVVQNLLERSNKTRIRRTPLVFPDVFRIWEHRTIIAIPFLTKVVNNGDNIRLVSRDLRTNWRGDTRFTPSVSFLTTRYIGNFRFTLSAILSSVFHYQAGDIGFILYHQFGKGSMETSPLSTIPKRESGGVQGIPPLFPPNNAGLG